MLCCVQKLQAVEVSHAQLKSYTAAAGGGGAAASLMYGLLLCAACCGQQAHKVSHCAELPHSCCS